MPLPGGLNFIEAASLPEAFFTAWNNIIWLGRLGQGETLLVQGGSSGVGLAGIQMTKLLWRTRFRHSRHSGEARNLQKPLELTQKSRGWRASIASMLGSMRRQGLMFKPRSICWRPTDPDRFHPSSASP